MTRRRIAAWVLVATAAILLSSMLAYRMGRHHPAADHPDLTWRQTAEGGCVDFQDAAAHTSENACVSGRVLQVYTSRSGNTFLDFCRDYRHCPFTSVIFASDRSHFGNLASLEGQQVEITGEITSYNGRAEIIIHGPEQIRTAR